MSRAQKVVHPDNAERASFRLDYTCECGKPRAVMANGIRMDLPLSHGRRPTGPCPRCGRSRHWVVHKDFGRLIVKVL